VQAAGSPVIPFGRTNSSNISLLTRSSSSAAFEAMQEDEDEVLLR